jgi:hypothetical protein
MPGSVRVAPSSERPANVSTTLTASAMFATSPSAHRARS